MPNFLDLSQAVRSLATHSGFADSVFCIFCAVVIPSELKWLFIRHQCPSKCKWIND